MLLGVVVIAGIAVYLVLMYLGFCSFAPEVVSREAEPTQEKPSWMKTHNRHRSTSAITSATSARHRTVPAGRPSGAELCLTPGMVGVVILSTGTLAGPHASKSWHIQIQFDNGFHFDVTPQNAADFEMAHGEGSPTAGQS